MLSVVTVPEKKRGRGRPPIPLEEKARRAQAKQQQEARQEAQQAIQTAPNAVEQARAAFCPGNRLSGLVGLALGGFVPLASYTIVHTEVGTRPGMWILVAGGLVYSAISVYTWARRFMRYSAKAASFVVLMEGTLTFSHIAWLSLMGLSILVVLNGVTAAVTLQEGANDNAEI